MIGSINNPKYFHVVCTIVSHDQAAETAVFVWNQHLQAIKAENRSVDFHNFSNTTYYDENEDNKHKYNTARSEQLNWTSLSSAPDQN